MKRLQEVKNSLIIARDQLEFAKELNRNDKLKDEYSLIKLKQEIETLEWVLN